MKLEINAPELEPILKNFHILTGIRIVLFDSQYNEIYSYPEYNCRYCQEMKSNVETKKLCDESDKASFETCNERKDLFIYHCHAGLIEATMPLIDQGSVIGYMMFGQISDNPHKIYTPDIPLKSSEQIEAAAKIMEACTFYVIYKNAVSAKRDNFILNMDSFINDHLSEDLSISSITKELGISKTKLYDTCNEYYGVSISKRIKDLRIDTAKNLLKSTDKSISEIASDVGFYDYNYFCRVFKKEVGIPAKKYRSINSI